MSHFSDTTIPTDTNPGYTFPRGLLPTCVCFVQSGSGYQGAVLICPCCKRAVCRFYFGASYDHNRNSLIQALGCAGGCYVTAIGLRDEAQQEWEGFTHRYAEQASRGDFTACRANDVAAFDQKAAEDKLVARLERALAASQESKAASAADKDSNK